MRIDANTNTFTYKKNKTCWGQFSPRGARRIVGDARLLGNPRRWTSDDDTYAARIIVGFKREGPDATLDELVNVVRIMRTEQVGDPAATFLVQRGLYKHSESGVVVDEPGAQVVLINTPQLETGPREFERQVEELAETIADELGQEEVIVEIQKNGLTQKVFGVGK